MLMREILIKVVDLIDMALVLLQSNCDDCVVHFFIELLPDDLNESDFKDYFNYFDLVTEKQRPAMEDLAQQLRIIKLNNKERM